MVPPVAVKSQRICNFNLSSISGFIPIIYSCCGSQENSPWQQRRDMHTRCLITLNNKVKQSGLKALVHYNYRHAPKIAPDLDSVRPHTSIYSLTITQHGIIRILLYQSRSHWYSWSGFRFQPDHFLEHQQLLFLYTHFCTR